PLVPPTLDRLLFFFPATAPTDIYTLSLHDALPICSRAPSREAQRAGLRARRGRGARARPGRVGRSHRPTHHGQRAPALRSAAREDRKSTRLNSSHVAISYAVFCLKKKKKK